MGRLPRHSTSIVRGGSSGLFCGMASVARRHGCTFTSSFQKSNCGTLGTVQWMQHSEPIHHGILCKFRVLVASFLLIIMRLIPRQLPLWFQTVRGYSAFSELKSTNNLVWNIALMEIQCLVLSPCQWSLVLQFRY